MIKKIWILKFKLKLNKKIKDSLSLHLERDLFLQCLNHLPVALVNIHLVGLSLLLQTKQKQKQEQNNVKKRAWTRRRSSREKHISIPQRRWLFNRTVFHTLSKCSCDDGSSFLSEHFLNAVP